MKVHASHPQLRKTEFITSVYIFTCPGCTDEFYVRGAHVQADGSLRCRKCSKTGSYRWCPNCRQATPWHEFENVGHFARLGRAEWCLECAATETAASKPEKPSKVCAHCATEFVPSRRDARFCSGRCRVAAHRAS